LKIAENVSMKESEQVCDYNSDYLGKITRWIKHNHFNTTEQWLSWTRY